MKRFAIFYHKTKRKVNIDFDMSTKKFGENNDVNNGCILERKLYRKNHKVTKALRLSKSSVSLNNLR